MKVLLFYPNLNCQVGVNHGLMSMSALLKDKGHQVHLVNLNERVTTIPDETEFREYVASGGETDASA